MPSGTDNLVLIRLNKTISTVSLVVPPLSEAELQQLDTWFQKVLWESTLPFEDDSRSKPNAIRFMVHRLKGRLVLRSGQTKMVQGVREVFEITDSKDGSGDSSIAQHAEGKLVLIGKHVSDVPWQESLQYCLSRNNL